MQSLLDFRGSAGLAGLVGPNLGVRQGLIDIGCSGGILGGSAGLCPALDLRSAGLAALGGSVALGLWRRAYSAVVMALGLVRLVDLGAIAGLTYLAGAWISTLHGKDGGLSCSAPCKNHLSRLR